MGWLSRLGSKLSGAQRFGSKLLSSVGSIGQKLSSKAGGALDMLEAVPVAGQMVSRIPGYSTLRGVISGAGSLGRIRLRRLHHPPIAMRLHVGAQ